MATLLRIDASSRFHGSHSRELGDEIVQRWRDINPHGKVVVRDLVLNPINHIEDSTIAGFYTPKEAHDETLKRATALSDELLGELTLSDTVLITTPMYNFSIPSALKAWVDQIVRIGETFSYSPETGFKGLLGDKRVFVITVSGAVYTDEAMRPFDFMTPYLETLLGFLGLTTVEFISLDGSTTDADAFARSKQAAHRRIAGLELKQ